MVYTNKPNDFNPKIEVVSCFVEFKDTFLLLHRQDHKPQGNTWAVPAGKVDNTETLEEAVAREIEEEIGYQTPIGTLNYFKLVYIKYPDMDFKYHLFHLKLTQKPKLKINQGEHKTHKWVTPEESLTHNLIPGEDKCIKMLYGI